MKSFYILLPLAIFWTFGLFSLSNAKSRYREGPPNRDVYHSKKCITDFENLLVKSYSRNWNSAKRYCERKGMRLLQIETGNCYVELIKYFKDKDMNDESYWVGAHRFKGDWIWGDDRSSSIPYPFWTITYENGKQYKEPKDDDKDCVFLDKSRLYFMNADYCDSERKHYICEKIPVPDDDEYDSDEENVSDEEDDDDLCPRSWKSYRGSCYKLMGERKSESSARKYCQEDNAKLLSIGSQRENNFIKGLIEDEEDDWWIDLDTDIKTKWESDNSDNSGNNWWGSSPDCIKMNSENGEWENDYCSEKYKYICEKIPKRM